MIAKLSIASFDDVDRTQRLEKCGIGILSKGRITGWRIQGSGIRDEDFRDIGKGGRRR